MLVREYLNNVLYAITGSGLLLLITIPLPGQTTETAETEPDYVLPEVIITATRVNLPLQDVPISSTVIDREVLEASPALDVADILRNQTGTQVRRSTRGGVATATLRGAQSSQVLIVRDGLPINDAFNGLADLSRLTLDGIERIEIVRGPTSHLYGANALGGVINLITREPEPVRSLTLTYGSFNTWQYRLYAGQGDSANGLMISGEVNRSDGWRGNDDFLHRSVLGKLNATMGKVHLSALTGYQDSRVGVPGPKPDSPTAFGDSEVTSLFNRQESDGLYGLLSIDSELGSDWQFQLRLRPDRSTTYYKEKYEDWFTGDTHIGHYRYTTKSLMLSSQLERRASSNDLLAGFDLINERGFAKQRTTNEATGADNTLKWKPDAHSSALWAEYIWHRTNFLAVLGIRSDYHSAYGWHISPSLGIILHLGASTIRASAGEAYRAPTFNDLFWPDDGFTSGNPDLESEIGLAYEIGLEHHVSQAVTANMAVFRRDVNDMIAWAPTAEGKWQPSNVNRFQVTGLEAEISAQLKMLRTRISCTLLDAAQIDMGVKKTAAFTPSTSIGANLSTKIAGFDITLSGDYRSSIVNYYGDEEKRLPARIVADTRLTRDLKKVAFYIEMRNILNTKYCDQFGYTPADDDYPLPGRTFGIGCKLEF